MPSPNVGATGGGGCDRQDRLRPRTTRSREPPVSCEQTEHRPTTPARSSRTTRRLVRRCRPRQGEGIPRRLCTRRLGWCPRRARLGLAHVGSFTYNLGPPTDRGGMRPLAGYVAPTGWLRWKAVSRVDAQSALVKRHALLLQRVKNLSFRGCIHGLMGDLLGRRFRRTRRVAASREGRPSTADEKGNAVTHSPPPPIYTAQGGLRQAPGRAA
jgi:hypothetical protein